MNNNQDYDYSGLYENIVGKEPVAKQEPQGQYAFTGTQVPHAVNYQNYANNPMNNNMNSAPTYDGKPPKNKNKNGKRVAAFACATLFFTGISIGGGYVGSMLANSNSGGSSTVINQTISDGSANNAVATANDGYTVSQIASIVSPSVVEITTELATNSVFGNYVADGAGSGVIISQDGYIITNAHVIEGAQQIKVTLNDESEYFAQVVGTDSMTDLAVIKIDATNLTAATLGSSSSLQVGDFALAVGNSLGTLGGTVTDGIISALDREIYVEGQELTLLQTNAAVSPGNSGGGLFNARGELIGIVTAKSGDIEAEGLGFAIPIDDALEITTELMNNGYVTGRPAMGVTVTTVPDEQTAMEYGVSRTGVYIIGVNEGSAAQKAGLMPMDLIMSIEDNMVTDTSDVTEYLETLEVGDEVTLQIVRDNKLQTVTIVLEERSADSQEQANEDANNFFGEGETQQVPNDVFGGDLEDFFGEQMP